MRHRTVRTLAAALTLTATASVAGSTAEAAIIDFNTLANSGGSFYNVGMTYSEEGFTLAVIDGTLPFVTFGAGEVRYGGSPALYNNNGGGLTRLTLDDGGTFSISSIDLAGDTRFGSIPVSFLGTRADLSTVQFDLTLTNSQLMAFAFPTVFTDLVSLEWRQITPYHQFDNLVVEPTTSASVPEPGTLLLLCGGLLVGLVRGRPRPARPPL